MNKSLINRYLRKFGAEIHGLGYLENQSKTSFKNDPLIQQFEIIKKDDCKVIFDIGANRGEITQKYSDQYRSANIHSFEPIPEMYGLLEQKFRSQKNIFLNQLALADKKGEEIFNINTSLDTSSLLVSTKIGGSSDAQCKTIKQIKVAINTLDNYCEKHFIDKIDILKIDTQGSELKILKGAEQMLLNNRIRLIFCEVYFKEQYIEQPLFYTIANYLSQYNFELQDIYHTIYNSRQILWADAIFIHNSLKY